MLNAISAWLCRVFTAHVRKGMRLRFEGSRQVETHCGRAPFCECERPGPHLPAKPRGRAASILSAS